MTTQLEVVDVRTPDRERLEGLLVTPAGGQARTGLISMHPSTNNVRHFELPPLAEAGFAALRLKSRFAGDDSTLIVEEIPLDMLAGIKFLRERGCQKIVIYAHSGGGQISALYQSQAESPTITCTPAGDPPDLTTAGLIAADGFIATNCHVGRNLTFTLALDPSVVDEADPIACDESLNMYNPANYELLGATVGERGVRYSAEFLERYRAAQFERSERITSWCRVRLASLDHPVVRDMPFFLFRTKANPEYMDLSLNPADVGVETIWGDPFTINWNPAVNHISRSTTLRSFLSHYSWSAAQTDTLKHIGRVTVPTLVVQATADSTLPYAQQIYDASGASDKQLHYVNGATHWFANQPEQLGQAMELTINWLRERGF